MACAIRYRTLLPAAAVLSALIGCSPTVDQRGNLPEPDKVAEIRPGTTTKDQVAKMLGSPSSTGVFDGKSWYYISRRTEQVAFLTPDVVDQQVFIVNFDDRGVVTAVDHKGIKDARTISPAPGATPSPGRELTFLEQLLGNVGRFSGGGVSSGGGTGGSGNQGQSNPSKGP